MGLSGGLFLLKQGYMDNKQKFKTTLKLQCPWKLQFNATLVLNQKVLGEIQKQKLSLQHGEEVDLKLLDTGLPERLEFHAFFDKKY
jgi:hypothetical protein